MHLENDYIDEEGVFSMPLQAHEIDLLSCYSAPEADLEDGDD